MKENNTHYIKTSTNTGKNAMIQAIIDMRKDNEISKLSLEYLRMRPKTFIQHLKAIQTIQIP